MPLPGEQPGDRLGRRVSGQPKGQSLQEPPPREAELEEHGVEPVHQSADAEDVPEVESVGRLFDGLLQRLRRLPLDEQQSLDVVVKPGRFSGDFADELPQVPLRGIPAGDLRSEEQEDQPECGLSRHAPLVRLVRCQRTDP